MVFSVDPATVAASGVTEEGISAAIAAGSSAAAAAVTTVMPMGADLDSVAFAAAVNSAGAAYVGAAGANVAGRSEFAGAQGLASVTYAATEAVRDTALSL